MNHNLNQNNISSFCIYYISLNTIENRQPSICNMNVQLFIVAKYYPKFFEFASRASLLCFLHTQIAFSSQSKDRTLYVLRVGFRGRYTRRDVLG